MGYFPYIMKTMYLHIKLLNFLGYEVDIEKGDYPMEEPISIYKDDELVGLLRIENQNLLDFKRNNITICNMNLDRLNEKKEYKAHNKVLFHTFIKNENYSFDCYNALLTTNQRKNICLINDDYKIDYTLEKGIKIETINLKHDKIKKKKLRGD